MALRSRVKPKIARNRQSLGALPAISQWSARGILDTAVRTANALR